MLLPTRVDATVIMSYPDDEAATATDDAMREILRTDNMRWSLELLADRPPMRESKKSRAFADELRDIAEKWEIPFGAESSVLPSAAGLVPPSVPVLCGIGPVGADLYTAQEAVHRVSLVQRALMVTELLQRFDQGPPD
jgi:D-alanine-D-alanine ligase